ncbi:MAG TPA: hypothetical protein VG055_29925 [Planctomycetaceae bacterium]|jgi:hypothetical protein|nr:hypothetical protein [Planctomycetaceae bacterium]
MSEGKLRYFAIALDSLDTQGKLTIAVALAVWTSSVVGFGYWVGSVVTETRFEFQQLTLERERKDISTRVLILDGDDKSKDGIDKLEVRYSFPPSVAIVGGVFLVVFVSVLTGFYLRKRRITARSG